MFVVLIGTLILSIQKGKKMRKQENYLDYIKRNSRYSYQLNEHGNVEIIVKNEGFWNRILQITLKKPATP